MHPIFPQRKTIDSLYLSFTPPQIKIKEKYSAISLRNTTRCSSPSYWPSWVWQMYNIRALQEHACNLLLRIIKFQESSIPQDPLSFSFWLARNIPLDYDSRQKLLQTSNVVSDALFPLSLLSPLSSLRCLSL